jgi:hypothetical protein
VIGTQHIVAIRVRLQCWPKIISLHATLAFPVPNYSSSYGHGHFWWLPVVTTTMNPNHFWIDRNDDDWQCLQRGDWLWFDTSCSCWLVFFHCWCCRWWLFLFAFCFFFSINPAIGFTIFLNELTVVIVTLLWSTFFIVVVCPPLSDCDSLVLSVTLSVWESYYWLCGCRFVCWIDSTTVK